jgi:hypothetical protein
VRTAVALEAIATALGKMAALERGADSAQAVLGFTREFACPFCGEAPTTVMLRGAMAFGCSACAGPFVKRLVPDRTNDESFLAGIKWAESMVGLASADVDRERILEVFGKEIKRRESQLP